MSRGVTYDPVVTNQSTVPYSRPNQVKTTSVPYDPVCRQVVGTQTATPTLPSTG